MGRKTLTTSEVLEQFKVVHGDRYDYTLVEYINNRTNIKIICPKHGIFKQQPHVHKRGNGCPECGLTRKKLVKIEVIEQFKVVHGDRYDYTLVEYINTRTNIKIICPKHGVFEQRPNNHTAGSGCPECGLMGRKTLTTSEVLEQFKVVHGDRYDYTLVEYINTRTNIKIICPKHGVFEQRPNNHTAGSGCPECNHTSDNNVLYIWEAIGERWNDVPIFKVGVTSLRLGTQRIRQVASKHGLKYKLHLLIEVSGESATSLENRIHRKLSVIPKMEGDGATEFRACSDEEMAQIIDMIKFDEELEKEVQ